jgi:hypothetical protein
MALSTTVNYSLRKHDAGDLNWDVDVNWNMAEIDKKLKLLFANFLTCSTEIGTVAKTAAFSNFVLETGCLVAVKFVNGNSASAPTLDVNSTGAKAIQVNGEAVAVGAIVPNGIYLLAYDGTNWAMLTREMVSDAITDGELGIAPSQNAVYDALALKANASDVEDALAIKESIDNLTYNGTDLTVKFADEIAEYSDVWAWIKARITAVNYSGLNICDYIPFTLGAETIWSQIAGIDTYYRTGDTEIGHHIDFISKDCMATTYQWNTTNTNNGTADNASPYMVSALKASLDGLVASLPAGLQAQVIEKRAFLETRYSSSSALSNSTGWSWVNVGKLWIPTEHELFGNAVQGTKPYASGQTVQYPIFSYSYKSRIKGAGHNGSRANWWVSTVGSGNSTTCGVVYQYGYPYASLASVSLRVPLCFRIG